MENQKKPYLYFFLGLILLFIVAILILFGFYKNKTNTNQIFSSNLLNLDSKKIPEKRKIQFELDVMSPEYSKLHSEFKALLALASQLDYSQTKNQRAIILANSLELSENKNLSDQERAYALNIFNLVYLLGYNGDVFYEIVQGNPKLKSIYDENFKYISNLKKLNLQNVSGVMYNQNSVERNFSLQRTLISLNKNSYELHSNSYALLRQMLNFVQSNTLLGLNFSLEKKYTKDTFIKSKYYDGFVEYYDLEIEKIKNENKMYQDVGGSAYEIDTMYTEFLFVKLDRTPKEDIANRVSIAKQIIISSDNMYMNSDKFNLNDSFFFGYVFSAGAKVRLANTAVLSKEENEELYNSAESILFNLFKQTKNPNLKPWLAQLSPRLETSKALQQLAKRNSFIANYVSELKK